MINEIEKHLKHILPEEKYTYQKLIAERAKEIASSEHFDVQNFDNVYLVGLLSNSNKYIMDFPFDLPLEVCQAVGILNYEKFLQIHNYHAIIEAETPYAYIVRIAEMEIKKNEMDRR